MHNIMYKIIAAQGNAQTKATIHTLVVMGKHLRVAGSIETIVESPNSKEHTCLEHYQLVWDALLIIV